VDVVALALLQRRPLPRLRAPAQREQVRKHLRAAVLAYKLGWTEDDLVEVIGQVVDARPSGNLQKRL
jgi:alkylhydroperoxidase/carboxymuconolactone decarboxylase family protein YurZ